MNQRIHGFDALRAFALLLGIVIHSLMPYLQPAFQLWLVVDTDRSFIWTIGVVTIHSFRLQVFFLLAGYFCALLVMTRGWKSFARNRLQRIVVPFLVCAVVIVPCLQVMMVVGYSGREGAGLFQAGSMTVDATAYRTTVADFFLSGSFLTEYQFFHFWFLYYLIIIYIVTGVLASVAYWLGWRSKHVAAVAEFVGEKVQTLGGPWVAIPLLTLISALAMWPMELWQVDTPFSVLPDGMVLVYYLVFFFAGFGLYFQSGLIDDLRRGATRLLVAAGCCWPIAVALLLRGPTPGRLDYSPEWEFPALFFYSLLSWTLVLGLVGGFARWFQHPSDRIRELSDSAYWQYIMHLPLLFGLQLVLCKIQLPGVVEIVLQCGIVFWILLWTYRAWVRGTVVGRWLNGPRKVGHG